MLDTNAWLWMVGASSNLGAQTKALLREAQHELTLSVASAWEVVIKSQSGKLTLVGDTEDFIRSRLRLQQISPLAITLEHTLAVGRLSTHHRDPFDRIIVAQALVERLTLVTSDQRLAQYPIVLHDARS